MPEIVIAVPRRSPLLDSNGNLNGAWVKHFDSVSQSIVDLRTSLEAEIQQNLATLEKEISDSQGSLGAQHQRVTFSLPATIDWYRIATNSLFVSTVMVGTLRVSAFNSTSSQVWEVLVGTKSTDTVPPCAQSFGALDTVVDKIRLSTDSGGSAVALDLHLSVADATTVSIEFIGLFTPVVAPAGGATVLGTGSTTVTFSDSLSSSAVTSVAGRTGAVVLTVADIGALSITSATGSGLTASVSSFNLRVGGAPLPAGLYTVSIYVTATFGSGYAITPTFTWTDSRGLVVSQAMGSLGPGAGASQANYGNIPVNVDGTHDLSVAIVVTGGVTFNYRIGVSRQL